MKVGDGHHTSFWYDNWSKHGCLKEALGTRGLIDLGVTDNALVSDVLGRPRRRRRHIVNILNEVENEIELLRMNQDHGDDVALWKQAYGIFAHRFSTKRTWELLRHSHQVCNWSKGIWFTNSTPKYSFLARITVGNRLQTGDGMHMWNGTYFKADSLRTVDELIDPNSGNWIVDKVESLFVEKDAAMILNLKTSRILNDVYIWGFPNSGAYSSKSG
ncbi:uncharacterized protein LOC108829280 [Raphanus sativus]|uniref:Uncharacterized protein LOC108829280 n=1 Tax=Raphanus sativus TaxID=3726 RepID=A0A6J0LF13_RAPSA|nr:uncharacterized protein LOC108829280 [Raphanus sativus]